jgi:hypothetical protein
VYVFLVPMLIGFALAGASAFTAVYSQRWGERGGRLYGRGAALHASFSDEAAMNTLGIFMVREWST